LSGPRQGWVLLALSPSLLAVACGKDPAPVDSAAPAPTDSGGGEDTGGDTGGEDTGPPDPEDEIRGIQASSLPQGPDPCRAPLLARVIDVYDGDTFEVYSDEGGGYESVRLISVNTPELDWSGSGDDCYAAEARDYADETLYGELVWLTFDYKCFDDYDRTLAYAHRGLSQDDFFNYDLVRRGFAITYFWDDGQTATFDDLLADGEAQAQAEGAGLWGECF
jgi:endonuclease YncB( thermonuclease family)